jgi:hypothetical protein
VTPEKKRRRVTGAAGGHTEKNRDCTDLEAPDRRRCRGLA